MTGRRREQKRVGWPPGTVAALRRRLAGEDIPMPEWPTKKVRQEQVRLPLTEKKDGAK